LEGAWGDEVLDSRSRDSGSLGPSGVSGAACGSLGRLVAFVSPAPKEWIARKAGGFKLEATAWRLQAGMLEKLEAVGSEAWWEVFPRLASLTLELRRARGLTCILLYYMLCCCVINSV